MIPPSSLRLVPVFPNVNGYEAHGVFAKTRQFSDMWRSQPLSGCLHKGAAVTKTNMLKMHRNLWRRRKVGIYHRYRWF